MEINARDMHFSVLNQMIHDSSEDCTVLDAVGQRFVAAGLKEKKLDIHGIPGNALGAYLAGASVNVFGNAQDAVGDTMNEGSITIHGNIGDAAGYAMRGGMILVKGNAGYRAGIHMKEYHTKKPIIVIGGRTGSFLGEYQAGGLILVLGLHTDGKPIVGAFPCTGMHGGKMILRGKAEQIRFPKQVTLHTANREDMAELEPLIRAYSDAFGTDAEQLLSDEYTVVTPDSKNPYKQMYVAN